MIKREKERVFCGSTKDNKSKEAKRKELAKETENECIVVPCSPKKGKESLSLRHRLQILKVLKCLLPWEVGLWETSLWVCTRVCSRSFAVPSCHDLRATLTLHRVRKGCHILQDKYSLGVFVPTRGLSTDTLSGSRLCQVEWKMYCSCFLFAISILKYEGLENLSLYNQENPKHKFLCKHNITLILVSEGREGLHSF